MKTQSVLRLIAVAALALWAGHFISGKARAIPPGPQEDLAFSPVGIVEGQTARLNVSSLSLAPRTDPTAVELTFVDISGAVLKQTIVQLAPGQSAFFDFADVVPGAAAGRTLIRPIARVIPPGPQEGGLHRTLIIGAVEVFDNATGRTGFLYSPVSVSAGDARGGDD